MHAHTCVCARAWERECLQVCTTLAPCNSFLTPKNKNTSATQSIVRNPSKSGTQWGEIQLHISHFHKYKSVKCWHSIQGRQVPRERPLPLLLRQVYSGVIMRTQRAHYGCGTDFSAAGSSGVPALEMLAVEKWQRTWIGSWRGEGPEQIWRKCGDEDGELLAGKSRKKRETKRLTWSGQWWTRVKRGTEIESERPGGEQRRNHSCFQPPPSASPNHPDTGRRQNQKHKQVDRTTCKGKNTNHRVATHILTRTHAHARAHSLYEQSSCVQQSWERQQCLAQRHHLRDLCHGPGVKTHLHRGDCLHKPIYLFGWHEVILRPHGAFLLFIYFQMCHLLQDLAVTFTFEKVIIKRNFNIIRFWECVAGEKSNFSLISGGSILLCVFPWSCLPSLTIISIIQIVKWQLKTTKDPKKES